MNWKQFGHSSELEWHGVRFKYNSGLELRDTAETEHRIRAERQFDTVRLEQSERLEGAAPSFTAAAERLLRPVFIDVDIVLRLFCY